MRNKLNIFAWYVLFIVLLRSFSITHSLAQGTIPATESPGAIYLPVAANFIPTATPTPTSTPLATATAIPNTLFVKSTLAFTSFGTLYVVGEVMNGSTKPAYFVHIDGKFFDANDQLVAVEDTYTYFTMTSPGQTNPFNLLLLNAPTTITRYELTVTSEATAALDYRMITVLSQQVRDNSGAEVFGEVRNDTEKTVRPVKVAVTFYAADGNVVYTDSTYTGSDLTAGQAATYSIKTFRTVNYASFSVQAQSYLVP